ncbi:MAG: EpsG family protein [Muribaculaceae bacterium]|nr:EpsG family protein [Muribaculaceae bacterium]
MTLTIWQALYCTLLYTIILIISYHYNVNPRVRNARHPHLTGYLFVLILIYCVTDFIDGDFFHYMLYVTRPHIVGLGFEKFYDIIIELVGRNYVLFRIIVWGLAISTVYFSARQYKCNTCHLLFTLATIFILTFAYARASLGMAVCFCGYIILCTANKNIFKMCLGIGIMCLSMTFHRSMIIAVVIALGVKYINFTKFRLILSLFLFPVTVLIANIILNHVLDGKIIDDRDSLEKIQIYSNIESNDTNWKGLILSFFVYARFYVPIVILAYYLYFKRRYKLLKKYEIDMFKVAYGLIYIASGFYFIEFKNDVLFYRILFMAMIPICFLLVSCVDKRVISMKSYRICLILGILYSYYRLTYSMYTLI